MSLSQHNTVQLWDELIPTDETKLEKSPAAILPFPERFFSLNSGPTAERLGSIFSRVLLFSERVFWFLHVCIEGVQRKWAVAASYFRQIAVG